MSASVCVLPMKNNALLVYHGALSIAVALHSAELRVLSVCVCESDAFNRPDDDDDVDRTFLTTQKRRTKTAFVRATTSSRRRISPQTNRAIIESKTCVLFRLGREQIRIQSAEVRSGSARKEKNRRVCSIRRKNSGF